MTRTQYGNTPWGKWFLEMLSDYDDAGRLSRGKTYANTGKVNALVINENSVGAKVKGKPKQFRLLLNTRFRLLCKKRK